MKKCLMILGLLTFSGISYASEISLMDSVGVERVGGKTFIIHQVNEKETLFGIARRYEAPMNEIIGSNPALGEGLRAGQRIRIPYTEKAALPAGSHLHKVNPGETLFSIAKTYQVSVQDMMAWNDLKGNDLSVGQSLIIKGVSSPVAENKPATPVASTQPPTAPSENRKAEENRPSTRPPSVPASNRNSETVTSPATGEWINHQVEQGQTLFAIAKQYDAKVDDLINWNGLTSTNLTLGQSLKVGRRGMASGTPTASEPRTAPTAPASDRTTPTSSDRPIVETRPSQPNASPTSTEPKNIKETGQAEVIDGTGNHKKYLVLHRTAPVGTIMRIRNEENDVTIFARVVGKLPETGDNNRLLVKVSKAAFDQLRAVNNRFPVEISY
ncbi:LysM peptidoglycan-binding domain-containing protein [Anditalea andensis]|uniref:Peptidoglycan-binding protein n=1 Tax=Anditalea andensis TaxID=1048983 RepID=A0A074KXR2_9BACT|nr:LysM peptidoglycan-binding domain-containing protein [Anditalea andensis]KEO74761.1 peptidoglycan-binding protein [Anditalea andensis]